MQCEVCVYTGEALARYGFPGGHPFGVDRHGAFVAHLAERGLAGNVCHREPVMAARAVIERFHTAAYVDFVMQRAARGGYFDHGDTPAFPGAYEAAACVVGTGVDAATAIMAGACRRAFVPIAGLHHARRDAAAGICVFNDCGVVIETLRAEYGLARIASTRPPPTATPPRGLRSSPTKCAPAGCWRSAAAVTIAAISHGRGRRWWRPGGPWRSRPSVCIGVERCVLAAAASDSDHFRSVCSSASRAHLSTLVRQP